MKKRLLVSIFSICLAGCSINSEIPSESVEETTDTKESVEQSEDISEKVLYEDFLKAIPKNNVLEKELNNDYLDKFNYFNNKLSNILYTTTNDSNENVVFSPLSIYMTLSLLEQCVDDTNKNKIDAYLGFNADENSVFFGDLCKYLNITERSLTREFSNSIWMSNALTYQESALDKLANEYYCYPFSVDFTDSKTNDLVHDFLLDMTHELIDYTPNYNSQTLVSLINTLYLNDSWTYMLSLSREEYDFVNSDGSITKTRLLCSDYGDGKIYKNDLYSEFETKTYMKQKIKFILPNEGHSLDEIFTSSILYEANKVNYVCSDNEKLYKANVLFPAFEAKYSKSLKDIFIGSEINSLFYSADLVNLLQDNVPTRIEEIYHVSDLKVTRDGITAAAITHIDTTLSSAKTPSFEYESMILNRPFAFIITTESDIPLYVGAVKSI